MKKANIFFIISFIIFSSSNVFAKVLEVPTPQNLQGNIKEKEIRNKINRALSVKPRGGKLTPLRTDSLVPNNHGSIFFLEYNLLKKEIIMIVERDARSGYISGGATYRSFALVDNEIINDLQSLWNSIHDKEKLNNIDIANLLVSAVMFQNYPNLILNSDDIKKTLQKWPKTENALSLNPPGIEIKNKNKISLQAWTIHSYSERGVSCLYLNGWLSTYSKKRGVEIKNNYEYADGNRLNESCGSPLP